MTRILFICHGNICRSPMAEMIFRELVRRAHREKEFIIDSTGTSYEESGNPVYPKARQALRELGYPCGAHAARRIEPEEYDSWDLLICMEKYNVRNLLRVLGGDPEGKIHLLMEYAGSNADVDDPYYYGNFTGVCRQIEEGCTYLLQNLTILSSKRKTADS